jgi:hypothetical protein
MSIDFYLLNRFIAWLKLPQGAPAPSDSFIRIAFYFETVNTFF